MKKIVVIFSMLICTLVVGLLFQPTIDASHTKVATCSQSAICTISAPELSCVTTLTHVPTVPMAKTCSIGFGSSNSSSVRLHRNTQIMHCNTVSYIRECIYKRHISFERNVFTLQIEYNIYRLCRILC